jgi:hypothetical protein
MRLIDTHGGFPKTGALAIQHWLGRFGSGVSIRRAIWSALHLLGAGIFVFAMLTQLVRADMPTTMGAGITTFPFSERPLPSDTTMN